MEQIFPYANLVAGVLVLLVGFWVWTGDHKNAGDDYATTRAPLRPVWTIANLATGLLTLLVAASQTVVP